MGQIRGVKAVVGLLSDGVVGVVANPSAEFTHHSTTPPPTATAVSVRGCVHLWAAGAGRVLVSSEANE